MINYNVQNVSEREIVMIIKHKSHCLIFELKTPKRNDNLNGFEADGFI